MHRMKGRLDGYRGSRAKAHALVNGFSCESVPLSQLACRVMFQDSALPNPREVILLLAQDLLSSGRVIK